VQYKEVPPAELAGAHRSYAGARGADFAAADITRANVANIRDGDATTWPGRCTPRKRITSGASPTTGSPVPLFRRATVRPAPGIDRDCPIQCLCSDGDYNRGAEPTTLCFSAFQVASRCPDRRRNTW
jgi:hypothetical protein